MWDCWAVLGHFLIEASVLGFLGAGASPGLLACMLRRVFGQLERQPLGEGASFLHLPPAA